MDNLKRARTGKRPWLLLVYTQFHFLLFASGNNNRIALHCIRWNKNIPSRRQKASGVERKEDFRPNELNLLRIIRGIGGHTTSRVEYVAFAVGHCRPVQQANGVDTTTWKAIHFGLSSLPRHSRSRQLIKRNNNNTTTTRAECINSHRHRASSSSSSCQSFLGSLVRFSFEIFHSRSVGWVELRQIRH